MTQQFNLDVNECYRLTQKYANIGLVPFDLPKLELDNAETFWKLWGEQKQAVNRVQWDRGLEGRYEKQNIKEIPTVALWDGLSLHENTLGNHRSAWKTDESMAMIASQPNYIKSILETIPFKFFRSIRLWSSISTIGAHRDGYMLTQYENVLQFPTEIRILLHDSNPTETFWLAKNKKENRGKLLTDRPHDKFYAKLPIDTNTFGWNNDICLHGADFNESYRKILVVIKGVPDLDRLETILDRSIEKYPEYIIRL